MPFTWLYSLYSYLYSYSYVRRYNSYALEYKKSLKFNNGAMNAVKQNDVKLFSAFMLSEREHESCKREEEREIKRFILFICLGGSCKLIGKIQIICA